MSDKTQNRKTVSHIKDNIQLPPKINRRIEVGEFMMNLRADLDVATPGTSLWQAPLRYFSSPSFKVVARYRIYSWLYRQGFLGKLLHKPLFISNCRMGVYLSPKTTVGRGLHLPHPVGVVVGDGAWIGDGVTLFQGVTLGVHKAGSPRYPRLEAGVTVYANAVAVGGITIGANAKIAALSFVNTDIPGGALAAGIPARIQRRGA